MPWGGSKAWKSIHDFFTSQLKKKKKHGFTCTLAQKLYRPQKNNILVFDSTPPKEKKSASNLACLLFKRTKIYETSHPLARFLHIPPTPIDPHNPLQTPCPLSPTHLHIDLEPLGFPTNRSPHPGPTKIENYTVPPKTGLDNLGGARWLLPLGGLLGGGSPAQGGRWMFCFGCFGWGVEVRFGLRFWASGWNDIFSQKNTWPAEVFKGKERWGLG